MVLGVASSAHDPSYSATGPDIVVRAAALEALVMMGLLREERHKWSNGRTPAPSVLERVVQHDDGLEA